MSSHIVEICEIDKVEKHPNADRLDLITVKGWQCVTGNGEFKVGDRCIYIPIDSILSPVVEGKLFGPDSKVKLHKSRVRTIKIRGAISQGMAINPELFSLDKYAVGENVASILDIVKYEPPENNHAPGVTRNRTKQYYNPNFHKYTDIENIKNYPNIFVEGEPVVVTEKIHGTNFRAGWVKNVPNTLWKKVKRLFGRLPEYEFVYGSRNVQLQHKLLYDGYYDMDVYGKIVKQYGLKEKLKYGEVIYGEIYGDGIQANYTYGCGAGEHKLAVFDVMVDEKYLHWFDLPEWPQHWRWLPLVPVLYYGPFNMEAVKALSKGVSVLAQSQPIREGVVVKPLFEETCLMGRKILKVINDDYLLDISNTDFH